MQSAKDPTETRSQAAKAEGPNRKDPQRSLTDRVGTERKPLSGSPSTTAHSSSRPASSVSGYRRSEMPPIAVCTKFVRDSEWDWGCGMLHPRDECAPDAYRLYRHTSKSPDVRASSKKEQADRPTARMRMTAGIFNIQRQVMAGF